jgi:TrmH family RNA methyltransferase
MNGAFLIEGGILIEEAIRSGAEPLRVFLRKDTPPDSLPPAVAACGAELLILPEVLFDEIAEAVTPRGVMAMLLKPDSVPVTVSALRELTQERKEDRGDGNLTLVVLDRLQDPGNLGTILRSADASGADAAILMHGTTDAYAPKACRAAAGALFRVPLLYAEDGAQMLGVLRKAGIAVAALVMDGQPCDRIQLEGRIAFVVGNEGGGVAKPLLDGADMRVGIPMRALAESLNAGVAASIILYEKARQERAADVR